MAGNGTSKISPSVLIKAIFSRNKDEFWWNHFTDEERILREMDVWALAKVIADPLNDGRPERRVVAEHMLNARLARIQANASWASGILGVIGAVLGAILGATLAVILSAPTTPNCSLDRANLPQTSQPLTNAPARRPT